MGFAEGQARSGRDAGAMCHPGSRGGDRVETGAAEWASAGHLSYLRRKRTSYPEGDSLVPDVGVGGGSHHSATGGADYATAVGRSDAIRGTAEEYISLYYRCPSGGWTGMIA